MAEFASEAGNKDKASCTRGWCYIFAVCAILLPIATGLIVWHVTSSSCFNGPNGSGSASNMTPQSADQGLGAKGVKDYNPAEPWTQLRLPNHVVPLHYDLTLYPVFYGDNGWFYGNETIHISVLSPAKHILIHSNFLNITRTELTYEDKSPIKVTRTFWYEENQFWVIEATEEIRTSRIFLRLQFDGSLTRANVGFYKSSYINSITKQERHLASSKFQPVDARRAFPCFDEPHIKANYTISLVHQQDYIALSNMPAVSTLPWKDDPSLHVTNFERSVAMSTYLVCFVVCDFGNLTDTTEHGTQIRVFATPDRISQAKYSLRVMKVSMDLYEELFKVPFPLPKNDMIAIPDFVSGAMEHWGLITYREINMLYDTKEASAANKQRVAVVVAHEIAHMWFGNIVTMDWWDDLWLNEGFASFVEYLGVNATEPQWEMIDQMIVNDIKSVMVTDSALSSHPIVVDVQHPDQITEVFDDISYSKGASVIRMLEEIMGKTAFFDGISEYLHDYEWSTARTGDLWRALGKVPGGYSVMEVMDTWTRQMGFPFINVTFSRPDGSQPGTRVTATQARFLADSSLTFDENESPYRYRWFVQLNYFDAGLYTIQWMTKSQDTVTFDVVMDYSDPSILPIKLNVNETGFYRVNYPDEAWLRFANALRTKGPSAVQYPADRVGLLDDSFNLARSGYLSYDVMLEMTKYLDQETHYLPWVSAYKSIRYLIDMFHNSGLFDRLRVYFIKKVRPLLDRLTWDDGPSHLNKLLRCHIIRLACDLQEKSCLKAANQMFRNWIDQNATLSPNVRGYVYMYGIQSGTVDDWDFMWQRYLAETVPQEQVKLLQGLAYTRQVWLLNRYLDYCKDPDKIRAQDFFTVLTYISQNPVGNALVWDWVRANWDYLVDRFSIGSRSLGRLVPSIVTNFNTKFKLQEVEDFFAQYPDAGAGERGRNQARETIQQNIDWMQKYSKQISEWFMKHI